jgi:Fe-S oxidoreductase
VFSPLVDEDHPLVGLEPSAILAFRDEYPELASDRMRNDARKLAKHCLTIDEFIAAEYQAGRIDRNLFTSEKQHIKYHGHCQQKAVASTAQVKIMLAIPANYSAEEIKSGCCGMGGAFGYEKCHYELSESRNFVLFMRKARPGT